MFDWKSRLSRVPVIGYAAKVVHDLSLLPVVRHDILAEVEREKGRVDAAELSLADLRWQMEALERHRVQDLEQKTSLWAQQTSALAQQTSACAQHLTQLLEHRSGTESRLHDLDRKLGDLDLVVNSLPGALREARRSERSAALELEALRTEVHDAVRLMNLAGVRADLTDLGRRHDQALAEFRDLAGALDDRVAALSDQARASAITVDSQKKSLEEMQKWSKAAENAAHERLRQVTEQWQHAVSELGGRQENMAEQLVRADQTAVAHAKDLEELRDRLTASESAAHERLRQAAEQWQHAVSELGGRQENMAEQLVRADQTAVAHAKDLEELRDRLTASESAAHERLRQAAEQWQHAVSELGGRQENMAEQLVRADQTAVAHAKD
ncbi:MAG: hypothetical protein ABSH47_25635, partial [Bryobacteraceae bacterium]